MSLYAMRRLAREVLKRIDRCSALIERDSKNPLSNEPCGRPAKGKVDGEPRCGLHMPRKKPSGDSPR